MKLPKVRLEKGISSRKAQLSAFIIIGIFILAIGGAYVYILTSAQKSESEKIVEKGIEATLDESKIREFITACIRKEGNDLIEKITEQGGSLNLNDFRYYFNAKYNYFCKEEKNSGCASRMITRQSMADELDNALPARLDECVNLEKFENEGYDISKGQADVSATIGVSDVNFEVIYPITISKDGQTVALDEFTVDVISNLGKLYDLAVKITYGETRGSFDEDRWMLDNAGVRIEKHRPYPDIVYSLKMEDKVRKKKEIFNFGLKGRYTIYDIGKPSPKKMSKGYCKTSDNNCYADAAQEDCARAGGEWSSGAFTGSQCTGLSSYEKQCKRGECKSCGKRKHGESWCEYEGIASPGFALVGSRHYKGSCIDGKISYTECRDFREEVCVENKAEITRAICRVNRWQDCAKQTTKKKCEDNSVRDCYWSGYLQLNRQQKCIPYIPPGFAHWQQNGRNVCAMANEQFDCNYYTCGQSWVDSSALYCNMMGDCGNYRNTEEKITYQGYFNVDSQVSDYVYLTKDQLDSDAKPGLKFTAESKPLLYGNEYDNPHGTIGRIMNNFIGYMDEVAGWKYEDFRYNYIMEGKVYVHVLQTALCMPWQAPYKGKDCRKCGSPNRPCTEYKCRSLGQTCTYEELNGIGFCYDYAEKDKTPPKLFFDGTTIGGIEVKQDFFGNIKGYRITTPLQPFAPLVFAMNATEPVRCKITALPQAEYEMIPLPASPTFENFYVFTDTIPQRTDFRTGLMKSIGVNNFLELANIESYDAKVQRIISDARSAVNNFGGVAAGAEANIDRLEQMWNNELRPMLKRLFDEFGNTIRDIAIQAEQNNKIVFFKCVDKAGNVNKEDVFVKYKIAEDSAPPYVIWVSQSNETGLPKEFDLQFFVTEPATCRYSFSDKSYGMMEEANEVQCTEPTLLGVTRAYACGSSKFDFGERNKMDIYIRCKDNPTTMDRYRFNLTLGNEMSQDPRNDFAIELDENNNKINLTPQWAQYFGLPDINEINVTGNTKIVINVDEKLDCRYSNKKGTGFMGMNDMECKEGPPGIFPCSVDMDVAENSFVEIACLQKFMEEERNENKVSTILTYSRS